MKLLLLLAISLFPTSPRPLTMSSFAVQCVRTRSVVVAADEDLTMFEAMWLIPFAIHELNTAAGRELFRFDGFISDSYVKDAHRKGQLVVGGANLKSIGPGVLGFSPPTTDSHQCITEIYVFLSPDIRKLPPAKAQAVVIHEFLHALGFSHSDDWTLNAADQGYAFKSIMTANVVSPASSETLTPGDILSIRAVYSNKF